MVVVVVCLIIVSTPGPNFVKVRARFGQFGDEYGQGFTHYMAKLVTRLAGPLFFILSC